MNLFFETAGQAQRFLCMLPLGFALALCLDTDICSGRLRILLDCLFFLLAGFAALCIITAIQENGIRNYHLLGLAMGAILYLEGIGKLFRLIRKRMRLIGQETRKRT